MLRIFGQRGPVESNLDRPISNFDVAGIHTGSWDSGLFECQKNIVPSCLLSFLCPCVMFSQIAVRAQIPLLIETKNAFSCLRRVSGYGFFIDIFLWTILLAAGLILLLSFVSISGSLKIFIVILVIIILGSISYLIAHMRTAFKLKYDLPSSFPDGWRSWDRIFDAIISIFCLPCSLAQMARHLFQYDSWNPPLGLYVADPSKLPPLSAQIDRPIRADNAGLQWTDHHRLPDTVDNTGAAHRREMLREKASNHQVTQPIRVIGQENNNVYFADGSAV